MRPVPSFHSWYRDVRAVRIALAASAVAGLVVIAACTDNGGSKSVTAPQTPRMESIPSGGFGQAKILKLCVSNTSPDGNYTFVNTKLNRNRYGGATQDGAGLALTGNGTFWSSATPPPGGPGDNNWYDAADGGDGTTTANATQGTPRILAKGACVDVLTAATITFLSASNGATYNHTNCLLDDGVLIPQQTNPPAGFPTWPAGGLAFNHNTPSAYVCDNHNNPIRAFVNYEHGATLTFFFDTPTGHNCTFTQGYYKNHETYTASVLSGNAGTTYIDGTGKLIIGSYHL